MDNRIENVPRVEKGMDKVSGTSLSKQWEMRKENIMIRNPAWSKFVGRIAAKAAQDLGVKWKPGTLKAKINRAHLSTVGACTQPYEEYVNRPYLTCFCR